MKRTKTRDKIKETAKNLFFKFGIKRVSVEEICKKAGVCKATFYKHYGNKMDLAKKLRNDHMDMGFAAFDEISALDIPFMEKVNRMTQWHMEFYSQMNNEFIRELASLRDIEEEFKKRFIKNIQAAQIKGEIRSDLNFELIYMVIRKLNELTREGAWKSVFTDYGQYIEQTRIIIFFGLHSRPDDKKNKGKIK